MADTLVAINEWMVFDPGKQRTAAFSMWRSIGGAAPEPNRGGDSESRQTTVKLRIFCQHVGYGCFEVCGGPAQEIANGGRGQDLLRHVEQPSHLGQGTGLFFVELNGEGDGRPPEPQG